MKPFDGHADQNRVLEIVAAILNGGPNKPLPKHAGTWLLEDPHRKKGSYGKAMQQAKLHLRRTLRILVDQWIDSGHDFAQNRKDIPKARSLFKRPSESFALEKYISGWLRRNPPTIGALSGFIGPPGSDLPDQPPMFLQVNAPQLNENLPPAQGGIFWGQELAGYWLLRLINCPIQRRFARCLDEECRSYFVYEHTRAE